MSPAVMANMPASSALRADTSPPSGVTRTRSGRFYRLNSHAVLVEVFPETDYSIPNTPFHALPKGVVYYEGMYLQKLSETKFLLIDPIGNQEPLQIVQIDLPFDDTQLSGQAKPTATSVK